MSTDLIVGDYAVFKDSSNIRTAPVYEVVGSSMVVVGSDFQHTVGLVPTDGSKYVKSVAVMANQLIRVAGLVGGSRRPDFNGEEPDIVY